jgi:plasmid maintenance system killer protein
VKPLKWEVKLGIGLVTLSVIIYTIKYLVLGNLENTLLYIFNSLGFLMINVLFVTLVINSLLAMRSRRDKLEKLNMVIGTFFSEIGTQLLTVLSDVDPHLDKIRGELVITGKWDETNFGKVRTRLNNFEYSVDISRVNLVELQEFLASKRDFMIRLLENPVLLEHQSFTELLMAVFHLTEELNSRQDLNNLPESDYEHLAGDIKRVYGLLVSQWLNYMQYVKNNYPYLFSLAMRTNPFDENASAIVKG